MIKTIFTLFILSLTYCFGQTTIFQEDFELGIPSNWMTVTNDQYTPVLPQYTEAWVSLPDPDFEDDTVAASTSYFTSEAESDRWLISPLIQIGDDVNTLSWAARSYDPSYPDSYLVLVSTTNTDISSFTDTLAEINEEFEDWTNHSVSLTDKSFNNTSIYVAFVNRTYDGYQLFVDSIKIVEEMELSTNKLPSNELVVFPNPSKGKFKVQSETIPNKIIIKSNDGKEVSTLTNTKYIDIENFVDGIYYLEIYFENKIARNKVVKQN